ncbi:hypothetical protein ACLBWX_15905 [Methylobacterium sp. M6A4_1b]
MPFLLAIVGLFITGLTYWIRYGNGLAHLDRALNDWRRDRRRRAGEVQQRLAPLRSMRNPADVAGVLMMLVARQRGLATPEQEREILSRMRSVTEMSEENLATRMAVIRHAADQTREPQIAIRDVAPLLHDRLTPSEVDDLVDMLRAVASIHGGPTAAQSQLVEQVRRAILEDR